MHKVPESPKSLAIHHMLPLNLVVVLLISMAPLPALTDCTKLSDRDCDNRSTAAAKIVDDPLDNQVVLIEKHTNTIEQHRQPKQPGSPRNKCATAERDLDRCSAQLIAFGHSEALYPDSMETLNSVYCPNFMNTVGCIKNITECYKPFEKQVINWILTSTRRMNYKRCKNESEKIRFLKLTNSCFAQMRNPMDKCMSRYVASLESVANLNGIIERLSENDIQIQLSCCANRRFKECMMNNAKQQCKPLDSIRKLKRTNSVSSQRMAKRVVERAAHNMMDDLIKTLDGMALTGPEFICSNVDETFCRSKFDGKFTGRASRYKSILPAMLRIYSNKL